MFTLPNDPSPRQRNQSRSTDDHSSTKGRPRRFFQRYVHDLSISSYSLATTSSHHDDPTTPSLPKHTSHATSAHSTPMTSPSTPHSSLFPGSLSSTTSESVPNPESKYQSEFGLLIPGSAPVYSPVHGSTSSNSSHPVSPRSRSTTESDSQASLPRIPRRYPSSHFSLQPSIPPHSPPVSPSVSRTDNGSAEHHSRSQSRLTVSIKNFLSKSAVPSPSRFSFNSAATTPSDSEASSRSFHVLASAGKWPMSARKSRPPDLEISSSVPPAIPSPGLTSNAPMDAHRRYASEAVAKIYSSRSGSGPTTSQESFDAPVRNVPLTLVRGREPKTRNVLRRRPSGSAKLLRGRERGTSSPCAPEGDTVPPALPPKDGMPCQGGIPFPLTAAGAVVEAYKQQELHSDDMPSFSKLSVEHRMSSSTSHEGRSDRDHLEHSPAPHSSRAMQAGSPDDRWTKFEADRSFWTTSQAKSSHQPSLSDSGARSITRKVSSRWRKVRGRGVTSEESPLRDKMHSKGQPSLSEIWRVDKSGTRSTGRSIDAVPNARVDAWAVPIEGHTRSESERGEGCEGGKLWRLMRRISTGGLRGRFQSDQAVPPVPVVPKELLKANQDERGNEPLPPSRHRPSTLRDKDLARTFITPKNARQSVIAPSSSPNSPVIASTQLFHRTHSARSSVSSYGEAVTAPGMPEIMLDQHIITPLEQLRLADDHVESRGSGTLSVPASRSPRRSTSVPAGLRTVEDGEGECVMLPLPRRQTCPGGSPSSGSSRPSSTSASASGSARASYQGRGLGPGGSRMEDGIVSLSPPPRSQRSSKRGASGSIASSPSHSVMAKQAEAGVGIGCVRQVDRVPSSQSDMTARVDSPEPGRGEDGDRGGSARTSTQLTFRQLDAPRRPPLSEREKADVWNDLLARSEKAGGTLHINGAGELMSDTMRFSMVSES